MRGKLLFATGAAVGYVLGARAGRGRYEQIKKVAGAIWQSKGVQRQKQHLADFIADRTPDVAEFVGETTKKAVRKASQRRSEKGSQTS